MDDKIELMESELGYLAGLIDGEGCINIRCTQDRYYTLQVITAQANEYLLDYWHKKTGLGSLHHMKTAQKSNPRRNEIWHWHCSAGNAEELLRLVESRLVLKREEARVALEFMEVCDRQQAQFRGRGKPRLTDEMLEVRKVYKDALHALKKQRKGAELERPLEVEYEMPESKQLRLFEEPRAVYYWVG